MCLHLYRHIYMHIPPHIHTNTIHAHTPPHTQTLHMHQHKTQNKTKNKTNIQNINSLGTGEMSPLLGALNVIPGDLGLILSTHVVCSQRYVSYLGLPYSLCHFDIRLTSTVCSKGSKVIFWSSRPSWSHVFHRYAGR